MSKNKIVPPSGGTIKQGFPAEVDSAGKIVRLYVPEGGVVDKAYAESQFADKSSRLSYRALKHKRRGEAMLRQADMFEAEALSMVDPVAAARAAARKARAALERAEAELAREEAAE